MLIGYSHEDLLEDLECLSHMKRRITNGSFYLEAKKEVSWQEVKREGLHRKIIKGAWLRVTRRIPIQSRVLEPNKFCKDNAAADILKSDYFIS
ncbi:unnamed protein product [Rhizophagus irregularis]|nr:unnamed protein product [Rhizophagus irregularis]